VQASGGTPTQQMSPAGSRTLDGAPPAGSTGQPAVLSTSESSHGASPPVSEPKPDDAAAGMAAVPVAIDNGGASAAATAAGRSAASAVPLLSDDAPATPAELAQPAEILAIGPPRNGGAAANMPASVTDRAAPSASSAVEGIGASPADGDPMLGASSGAASAPAAHGEALQSSRAADLSSTVGEFSKDPAPAAGSATMAEQPAAVLATDEQESDSSAVHVNKQVGASDPADHQTADARPKPSAVGMAGPEGKLSEQPAAAAHADSSNLQDDTEAEDAADAAGTEALQELRENANPLAVAADTGPESAASVASTATAAPTDGMAPTSASNTLDGAATAASPGVPDQLQGKPSKMTGAAPAQAAELERVKPAGLSQTCPVSKRHPMNRLDEVYMTVSLGFASSSRSQSGVRCVVAECRLGGPERQGKP